MVYFENIKKNIVTIIISITINIYFKNVFINNFFVNNYPQNNYLLYLAAIILYFLCFNPEIDNRKPSESEQRYYKPGKNLEHLPDKICARPISLLYKSL